MDSPTRKARESLSLSVTEFATAAGVQPSQVSLCERGGSPIPGRVRDFLASVPSIDVAAVTRDHFHFRAELSESLRERVCGRGGEIPAAHNKLAAAAGATK